MDGPVEMGLHLGRHEFLLGQAAPVEQLSRDRLGRAAIDGLVDGYHRRSAPAQAHEGLVGRDAVQPRGQAGSPLESPDRPERVQERLLEHIFGFLGIAQHAQAEAVDLGRVGLDQMRERFELVPSGSDSVCTRYGSNILRIDDAVAQAELGDVADIGHLLQRISRPARKKSAELRPARFVTARPTASVTTRNENSPIWASPRPVTIAVRIAIRGDRA